MTNAVRTAPPWPRPLKADGYYAFALDLQGLLRPWRPWRPHDCGLVLMVASDLLGHVLRVLVMCVQLVVRVLPMIAMAPAPMALYVTPIP